MITIDHSKFDIRKLNLSDLNETKLGNKWYFGYGNENSAYEIMTPELTAPFGIDTEKDSKKYIRCELLNHFYNPKDRNFLDILRFHEELVKLKLKDKLNDLPFFSCLKIPDDPKLGPSVKVKLNFRFNRFEVDFFDIKGDRVISSCIKKGTNIKIKLCPKEVWVNDNYYGILWSASQVMITD